MNSLSACQRIWVTLTHDEVDEHLSKRSIRLAISLFRATRGALVQPEVHRIKPVKARGVGPCGSFHPLSVCESDSRVGDHAAGAVRDDAGHRAGSSGRERRRKPSMPMPQPEFVRAFSGSSPREFDYLAPDAPGAN